MMAARAALLGGTRGGAAPFDPLSLSPALWLKKGDFSAAGSPDTWTATNGTSVTGTDDIGRTNRGDGVPRCNYVGSAIETLMSSAQAMPGIGGERHYAARLDLRGVSTLTGTAPENGASAIIDSAGYTGLCIYKAAGPTWFVTMYDYAGAAYRLAPVEITSLLDGSGNGSVTIQGRKRDTGGGNYVVETKVGSGAWTASASYAGATDLTTGTVRVCKSMDADQIELLAWGSALSDADATSVATYLAALT